MSTHAKINTIINISASASDALASAQGAAIDNITFDFPNGTGSGQVSKAFISPRTLAAGANENLRFDNASLNDRLNNTITLQKLKALIFQPSSTNPGNMTIQGSTASGFQGPFSGTMPAMTIPAGGELKLVHPGAGWTISGSFRGFKIANGSTAAACAYNLWAVGSS